MITVKEDLVDLSGSSDTITAELALLLHTFRNEFPELFLRALTAEEMLHNIKKEGK